MPLVHGVLKDAHILICSLMYCCFSILTNHTNQYYLLFCSCWLQCTLVGDVIGLIKWCSVLFCPGQHLCKTVDWSVRSRGFCGLFSESCGCKLYTDNSVCNRGVCWKVTSTCLNMVCKGKLTSPMATTSFKGVPSPFTKRSFTFKTLLLRST